MVNETHELLVRVRPDTGDTEDELDGVSQKFDETADETERTAGILGDMSNKMKGFGAVIVGTLTTLAAGIASRVPVIQENASALNAVIDAIALRIDERLRPSIGFLNTDLFALADAIVSGEGVVNSFMDVIGDLGIIIGQRLPGSLGDATFALGLTARNWDLIWDGIQGRVGEAVGGIEDFITGVPEFFSSILSKIEGIIIRNVIVPIKQNVNKAISLLNRLPGVNIDPVELGPAEVGFAAAGGDISRPAPGPDMRRRPTGGAGAGGGDNQLARSLALLPDTVTVPVNLDGRQIAKSQGRILGSGAGAIGRSTRVR